MEDLVRFVEVLKDERRRAFDQLRNEFERTNILTTTQILSVITDCGVSHPKEFLHLLTGNKLLIPQYGEYQLVEGAGSFFSRMKRRFTGYSPGLQFRNLSLILETPRTARQLPSWKTSNRVLPATNSSRW